MKILILTLVIQRDTSSDITSVRMERLIALFQLQARDKNVDTLFSRIEKFSWMKRLIE